MIGGLQALADNISDGLRSAATFSVATGMMMYMSPQLSLTVLQIVPPIALSAVLYGRAIKRVSAETQDALADSTMVHPLPVWSQRQL